jgi:FkbM family methyltransferase
VDIKLFLKTTLRRYGFDIVRYAEVPNHSFPVLPLLVKDQLEKNESFYFIQIGANDGVLDDPLRELIIGHHLSGLLIEPLPDMFDKLRFNYKDQPQLIFENVAISTEESNFPMYRVNGDASVPLEWHGMASFNKKHLLDEKVPDACIETCSVRTVPLKSLIGKYQITNINLLQVDTEGYDGQIVLSTLRAGIIPKIINYEHVHLSSSTRLECKVLLAEKRYCFIEVGKDTLAVQQSEIIEG